MILCMLYVYIKCELNIIMDSKHKMDEMDPLVVIVKSYVLRTNKLETIQIKLNSKNRNFYFNN